MYETCDILVINKIDTLPVFDFDMERVEKYARECNKDIKLFAISAKTGEGVEAFAEELLSMIKEWNA